MSDPSLISAFHKPTTLDEQLDSIHQAAPLSAVARIQVIARNQDGYTPEQVLVIFETALTREVRTNPQRRSVIQALKNAIKKAAAAAEPTGTRYNRETGLVELTTEQPRRPEWDAVRDAVVQITFAGRMFVRGQVKLGMLLAGLKKAHGVREGRPSKNSPESGQLISWKEIVKEETGFSRQSGDEFIRLYEAAKVKLKKSKTLNLPAGLAKDAIVLFQSENALALTEEQWIGVDELIGTLTTGETQASLMQELGLVPKPKKMPKGGKGGDEGTEGELTAGQLAFHFFDGMASGMVNARTNPDYKKLLLALPIHSDSEHPLSLASLEAEARALLADIEDAKQAAAKPAKGRVIEAATA
jgi:hypothetical protein